MTAKEEAAVGHHFLPGAPSGVLPGTPDSCSCGKDWCYEGVRVVTGREQRYTLPEATVELRRQECATHGHSWDVIETMERPVALVCGTCGRSHDVSATARHLANTPGGTTDA